MSKNGTKLDNGLKTFDGIIELATGRERCRCQLVLLHYGDEQPTLRGLLLELVKRLEVKS